MAKKIQSGMIEIYGPSRVAGIRARLFIKNPKSFSILAQWDVEAIRERLENLPPKQPRPERFENLNEVVKYFTSIQRRLGKKRIAAEWTEQKYRLACGATLVATTESDKTKNRILIEWPTSDATDTPSHHELTKMVLAGIPINFPNASAFVAFAIGLDLMKEDNYRDIINAMTKHGDSFTVAGVAKLSCIPTIGHGRSTKGNMQVTTNTKYQSLKVEHTQLLAELETAESMGIDIRKIVAAQKG